MKKYVIKRKGVNEWVISWMPISNTFVASERKEFAMQFSITPIHVMTIYDKLNEFEIVEL